MRISTLKSELPTTCNGVSYGTELVSTNLITLLKSQVYLYATVSYLPPITYAFLAPSYKGREAESYSSDGVILMDVDDEMAYTLAFHNWTTLKRKMPNIIALWPSRHRKLHLAFYAPYLKEYKGEELVKAYKEEYELHICRLATFFIDDCDYQGILEMSDKGQQKLDLHNAYVYQSMYLNPICNGDLLINDNISDDTDSRYKGFIEYFRAMFPTLMGRDTTKVNRNAKTTALQLQLNAPIGNIGHCIGDKWRLDKTFTQCLIDDNGNLFKYNGNDLRIRVGATLLAWLGYDKARQIAYEYFEHPQELVATIDSKYRNGNALADYRIITWLKHQVLTTFVSNEHIHLSENEYVCDYYDTIIGHLKEQSVYVKAGCGVGKSTLYRKIYQREDKVIIVCHLNSIRDGVYNKDGMSKQILMTKEVGNIIFNDEELPNKMIINWNSYQLLLIDPQYKSKLNDYVKCIDEAHNLILTLSYRSAVVFDLLRHQQPHTLYCSATPLGETALLDNIYTLEFTKDIQKKVQYAMLAPIGFSRQDKSLEEVEEYTKVDYVATIIQYIKHIKSEAPHKYDSIAIYDNRNYNVYKDAFPTDVEVLSRTRRDEEDEYYWDDKMSTEDKQPISLILDNNVQKQHILSSTVYGTQGIEIKQRLVDVSFRNFEYRTIDNLLVIIPLRGALTSEVEQFINRFRTATNVHVLFVFTEYRDTKQFEQIAKIISELGTILEKMTKGQLNEIKQVQSLKMTYNLMYPNQLLEQEDDIIVKAMQIYHNMTLTDTITPSNFNNIYGPKMDSTDFFGSDRYIRGIVEYPYVIPSNKIKVSSCHQDIKKMFIDDPSNLLYLYNCYGHSMSQIKNGLEEVVANYDDVSKQISSADCKAVQKAYEDLSFIRRSLMATDITIKGGKEGVGKSVEFIVNVESTIEEDERSEQLFKDAIKVFTWRNQDGDIIFHRSALKTWLIYRERLIKYAILGDKYLEGYDEEFTNTMKSTYSGMYDRLGLDMNIYSTIGRDGQPTTIGITTDPNLILSNVLRRVCANGLEFDTNGRLKGGARGKSVGKSKHLKFRLLSDSNVLFTDKKSAYEYLISHGLTDITLSNFEKRKYKDYITRIELQKSA